MAQMAEAESRYGAQVLDDIDRDVNFHIGIPNATRLAGRALGLATAGTAAWAAWQQLAPYLQNITPGAGWAYCNFCGVFPGSLCLEPASSGIYYTVGSNLGCGGAGAKACLSSQSVAGLSRTDTFGANALRIYYLAYQVSCSGGIRASTVMTWARTTPKSNAAPLPYPARPPIGWIVPNSLAPALEAGDTLPASADARAAMPWGAIPQARPLPLSFQTRQGAYHAGDRESDNWLVPPMTVEISFVDGRPNVRPVDRPTDLVRTGFQEPEKKRQYPKGVVAMWRAMAWFSEAGDFVDVLFKSLPVAVQKRYRRIYGNNIMMRARALRDHWQEIDIGAAVQWWALNQAEDAAYGTAFAGVSRSARASGNEDLWRIVQAHPRG